MTTLEAEVARLLRNRQPSGEFSRQLDLSGVEEDASPEYRAAYQPSTKPPGGTGNTAGAIWIATFLIGGGVTWYLMRPKGGK